MGRNQNSRFATNPTNLDMSRSTFMRDSSVKTSFNIGDIIPFYLDEVLPGDTHHIKTSKLVRLQTLVTPVMDNIYLDTYYFFVPNRLVWEHWKEFNGENTQSPWFPSVTFTIPQITSPSGGWNVGTIADYMGLPTGVSNLSVSAIPFRAYALICNEWFRSENLSQPLNIPVNDTTQSGSNGSNFITDVVNGGKPYTACKYQDYFTSCLPSPQKGPDVTIPLGTTAGVFTGPTDYDFSKFPKNSSNNAYSLRFGKDSDGTKYTDNLFHDFYTVNGACLTERAGSTVGSYDGSIPLNLYADLTNATSATINQLRLAFQTQKLYERDARGGSRYTEILKSHFGVTSPDARQQRPEYLGGTRQTLNINQVVQTAGTIKDSSSTISNTPQGTTAAYSVTTDTHSDFIKSFTEHGYIIGVCVARYDHSYQQGIERHWSRKTRFSYYWPALANIGEQAVLNSEIYAQGSAVLNPTSGKAYDDEVFGYNEAWADYRYKPSHVTGEMRSTYATSLDSWHLADEYNALPALSDSWIREDKANVDRCLAVQSSVSNQLFGDFYIQNHTTRPMPLYSVPGLIDHH